jgi:hypothetical protein
MSAWAKAQYRRFWLKVYFFAARQAGPLLDKHREAVWQTFVVGKFAELSQSNLSGLIPILLGADEHTAPDSQGRDFRDPGRDVRLSRAT